MFLAAALLAMFGLWQAEQHRADVTQKQVKDLARQEGLRTEFTKKFAAAERRRPEARTVEDWRFIRDELLLAFAGRSAEPDAFADFELLSPADALLTEARRELTSAREKERAAERLTTVKDRHADAVFFG